MKRLVSVLFLGAILLPVALRAQVTLTKTADGVNVEIDGKPFTKFYAGGEAPKPYLHPLLTADGKRITRLYPMENVPGETKDHPHHRGLWFTHGDVNGLDFWMNEKTQHGGKVGIITLDKIEKVQSGKKAGTVVADFTWETPDNKPILTEHRTMVFREDPKLRIIDFDVTFTAVDKVKFGDTKEGFFAIRLRDELAESRKGTGHLVNPEGKTGMKEVWGKRAPWLDYWGTLDGEKLGVAIFDHPQNPKHPAYWHARDYGLFAVNQFGEHDFYNDKTRDGSMTIEPKQSLRFRYRVLIHPGDTQEAGIAKLYDDYVKGK
jgi:hypothetical protein